MSIIDNNKKNAFLRIIIGDKKYWNGITALESEKFLLKFAFNKLKLRRLTIPAFVENEGSNGLAKKLGFKYEGTSRKCCRAKSTGKIHDENFYVNHFTGQR